MGHNLGSLLVMSCGCSFFCQGINLLVPASSRRREEKKKREKKRRKKKVKGQF